MSAEIALSPPPVPVAILGVNAVDHDSGNDLVTAGRVLPWLQDDEDENVWDQWSVEYRDVVVLDALNQVTAIYNLTTRDLANPIYYAELKALLLDAATP